TRPFRYYHTNLAYPGQLSICPGDTQSCPTPRTRHPNIFTIMSERTWSKIGYLSPAREMRVVLLAAPKKSELKRLIRRTRLLRAAKSD
ncbi:MAG: hypothetical protein ACYS4W_11910, partial [Planctomycetota bacterium]